MEKEKFLRAKFRNRTLKGIQGLYKENEKAFEEVKNAWNTPIRNFLAKNMGVSLTNDNYRASISVSIEPAFNERIIDLLETKYPDLDLDKIFKLQDFITYSKRALPYIVEEQLHENLQQLISYAEEIINKNEADIFIEDMFNDPENKDTMGCYFLGKRKIEIYVLPIIIFCKRYNLDIEPAIINTLCHELAHGYSHIGLDKDKQYWENMGKADDFICEGIAQYFTLMFARKNIDRNHNIIESFYKENQHLGKVYREFENWDVSFEQFFRAFIEMRRRGITRIEEFRLLLREAHYHVVDYYNTIRLPEELRQT